MQSKVTFGRMARVTLGLCSVLAVLAVGAGTAAAGIDTYCGKNFSNFETCTGPFHTAITWSAGQHQNFADANRVCAGAYDSSGNFYGSYFCATGVACHVYGSDPLTPAVHDGEDHAATDVGVSYWSQAYPPGCPAGS